MQQASSLTFFCTHGDGIQHPCHLLLTAAGANLCQCLLQGRLLEDGLRIGDGLISCGERLLVLFLCCGQRALLGKVVAESLHCDLYRGGCGFCDDLVDQTALDGLCGRNIAPTYHQTQRFRHARIATSTMQFAHQALCTAIAWQ